MYAHSITKQCTLYIRVFHRVVLDTGVLVSGAVLQQDYGIFRGKVVVVIFI